MLTPYHWVMGSRRALYRSGWLPSTRLPRPVISVGNLAWGGTGKTPLVAALAERIRARGLKPAIVSRGYGRLEKDTGPQQVTSTHCAELNTEAVGDEAIEHALEAGRWTPEGDPETQTCVVVSTDREAGARYAVNELGADAILLDDGFQHLAIQRDLDMLVLDSTDPWASGLLREPPSTARCARLIALSRTDVVSPEEIEALLKQLQALGYDGQVLRGSHTPDLLLDMVQNPFEPLPLSHLAQRKALLVSAVANPEGVRRTIRTLGVTLEGEMRWIDHHRYYMVDILKIEAKARELGVDTILTTRKDAVKLAPYVRQSPHDLSWLALQIAWEWRSDVEILDRELEKCLP